MTAGRRLRINCKRSRSLEMRSYDPLPTHIDAAVEFTKAQGAQHSALPGRRGCADRAWSWIRAGLADVGRVTEDANRGLSIRRAALCSACIGQGARAHGEANRVPAGAPGLVVPADFRCAI